MQSVFRILGTRYTINLVDEKNEVMKENNYDGYTDFVKKEIYVINNESCEIIIRHEIIHAFLYESGIDIGMLFHTEECVDYFAMQFEKMGDTMELVLDGIRC